jgi:hypothetical protein
MLSRLRSLVLRLTGSQELRPPDALVVASLIMIPLTSANVVIRYYQLRHPEAAPFLDHEVLAAVVPIQIFGPILSAGFLLAGLLSRKRWPDRRLLAHAAAQFFMVAFALYSYLLGHYTSPLGAMMLIAGATMGMLLFDARIVRASLITFLAIVVVTTIGERMGILPYAPLLAELSISGRLPNAMFLQNGLHFSILLLAAFLFVAAMQVARDREQQLRRATLLIRRYIPAQLAAKILAGEYREAAPQRRKLTLYLLGRGVLYTGRGPDGARGPLGAPERVPIGDGQHRRFLRGHRQSVRRRRDHGLLRRARGDQRPRPCPARCAHGAGDAAAHG